MTTVSIVMSVMNRPTAFKNILTAWSQITYPVTEFIIVDNVTGNPGMEGIAKGFMTKLPITYHKEPAFLNVNQVWNKYGKASKGEYLIFAMQDEIISDFNIIEKVLACPNDRRCSVLTHFLDQAQTSALETFDWHSNPRSIPMPDKKYDSAGILSHITGAWRTFWDWIGWFRDFDKGHLWLEQDIHIREKCIGRLCETVPDVYCLHQFHPVPRMVDGFAQPGFQYKNEMQARLLEEAERDKA